MCDSVWNNQANEPNVSYLKSVNSTRMTAGMAMSGILGNLPWVCTATFESDSSFSRHLPLSPTPPLLCRTCEAGTISGGLAKLASAGRFQDGKMFLTQPTTSCLQCCSAVLEEWSRKQRFMSIFYSTTPWRPTTSQVPATQAHRRPTDVLFSARHWWQSRWQHSPPTFPGSVAFTAARHCCFHQCYPVKGFKNLNLGILCV